MIRRTFVQRPSFPIGGRFCLFVELADVFLQHSSMGPFGQGARFDTTRCIEAAPRFEGPPILGNPERAQWTGRYWLHLRQSEHGLVPAFAAVAGLAKYRHQLVWTLNSAQTVTRLDLSRLRVYSEAIWTVTSQAGEYSSKQVLRFLLFNTLFPPVLRAPSEEDVAGEVSVLAEELAAAGGGGSAVHLPGQAQGGCRGRVVQA